MILGDKSLYLSAKKSSTSSSVKSFDESKSFFVEALDILIENNRNINNILKKINVSKILAEDSNKNNVYLTEFSISGIINSIIDFFVNAIQSLWNKFKNLWAKITFSDRTIEKYADKIKNMKGSFNLSFSRYIYTCTDPDLPSINLKQTFYDDLRSLQNKLDRLSTVSTKAERISKMQVIESEIKDNINPSYYDMLRRNCLKVNGYISSTDFPSALFNRFRNGGQEVSTKIDATELTIVYNRYTKHKDLIKDVEKLKADTIKSANEVKDTINSMTLSSKNKYYTPYDTDEEVYFSNILKTVSNKVNEACNIYVMAFSAKVDALKESAIQDKKVLYEAIKFINLGGENND